MDELRQRVQNIERLVRELDQAKLAMDESCPDLKAKEREALESIEEAKETLNIVDTFRRERDPEVYSDIVRIRQAINSERGAIRALIAEMPLDALRRGQVLTEDHVRVRVSRATVAVSYNKGKLEHLWGDLREVHLDGDPVIVESIDDAVLDRIYSNHPEILGEMLPAVQSAREEKRTRAPQISIQIEGYEADDEPTAE